MRLWQFGIIWGRVTESEKKQHQRHGYRRGCFFVAGGA